MSKMKRALWFKDKFLLDDKTVYHVSDVRWEPKNSVPGRNGRLYFIMWDMKNNWEFWHEYRDKKRKSEYIVVTARVEGDG